MQQHGETLNGQHGTTNEQCRAKLGDDADAAHGLDDVGEELREARGELAFVLAQEVDG